MNFIKPYFSRQDDRGKFIGLLNFGQWEEVNYLFTKAGEIRGNHYHKDTIEVFYIIAGSVKVTTISSNGSPLVHDIKAGEIFEIPPGEIHTFHCLSDCEWLNFLSKKMDPASPDIIPAHTVRT